MLKMYVKCVSYLHYLKSNKKGQGMVEYGLIVGLIAIAVIVAITTMGEQINRLFEAIGAKLTDIQVPQ